MQYIGVPSYHTRVERWECDFNNHWNTRYYGRSFQMAAESVTATGCGSPGAAITRSRHMRFHRELFVSAAVQVHSARIAGGAMDGAVLHVLSSGDRLAATALDRLSVDVDLPTVPCDVVPLALPRGLPPPVDPAVARWSPARAMPLGPVHILDVDYTGLMGFEAIIRCTAIASHHQLNALGFTTAYSGQSRINRMAVELRVTLGSPVRAGRRLWAQSSLLAIRGKNFWLAHRILTEEGKPVATIEQCLVTVNLDTRKAVQVPDLLHAGLPPAGA